MVNGLASVSFFIAFLLKTTPFVVVFLFGAVSELLKRGVMDLSKIFGQRKHFLSVELKPVINMKTKTR